MNDEVAFHLGARGLFYVEKSDTAKLAAALHWISGRRKRQQEIAQRVLNMARTLAPSNQRLLENTSCT